VWWQLHSAAAVVDVAFAECATLLAAVSVVAVAFVAPVAAP